MPSFLRPGARSSKEEGSFDVSSPCCRESVWSSLGMPNLDWMVARSWLSVHPSSTWRRSVPSLRRSGGAEGGQIQGSSERSRVA